MDPLQSPTLTSAQLEGLYGVAFRFFDNDDLPHAVRAFRVMVRFAPTDERGWLGLGLCHELMSDDDVAAEIFGAGAVVSQPPSARCLVALARLRAREGDAFAAKELLNEAATVAEESSPELLPSIANELGACT